MKTSDLKTRLSYIFSGAMITMMIFSLVSCSTKALFLVSPVVPAAEGYVKIKSDKNKNYAIEIKISNLAAVERLQPPNRTYVVWMVTDQEAVKNIGKVTSSKKLKVSFKTVSSFKPTKFFITAEDNDNPQYPGEQVVLSTENFQLKSQAGTVHPLVIQPVASRV